MADARRNLRLVIAYAGTSYAGWQIQPNAPTVQGTIERRLAQMTGQPCRLRAAGRTDAGVHAAGQVANFTTESRITCRAFLRGLNALLPDDVSILSVEEVPPEFDSRRHNKGKYYRYTIWNTRPPSPRLAATTYHLHRALDLIPMAEAARALVGTHDFVAFRSASCERETTVRTLYRCTVSADGPLVEIHVEGTAFLKNMVRVIAGTLIEVGRGLRPPGSLPGLLADGDRRRAGITAPACGLTLVRVML
jgi:tRNA pseudouridine38-40 synthase